MKDFMIGIPSYKRAQYLMNRVNTLDHMEPWELERTLLFVREEEMDEYLPVAEKYGCGLQELMLPFPAKAGIPETRDAIFDYAIQNNYKNLIMIDDDIDFAYKPDARKYITMTGQNRMYFRPMIETMLQSCTPEVPVVGITARQFSQAKTSVFDYNTRIIQVYCWDMSVIEQMSIQFNQIEMPFMTDYYIILRLLTLGYKNICLNRWCRDDKMQMPGGCAETRTAKVISSCALKLARTFPEIVKPYFKTGGTWGKKHIGVRVAWKKAYEQGEANYGEQK